jgi:hypothetical protein
MQLGKNFVVEWSTLPCNILFSKLVVKEDCRHVVWVGQISQWTEASKFEEVIDHLGISLYHCRPKNLIVILVDAALNVLNVDGHDPYETTTWIWYAKDLGPLYVLSLSSGLCFKVRTSL